MQILIFPPLLPHPLPHFHYLPPLPAIFLYKKAGKNSRTPKNTANIAFLSSSPNLYNPRSSSPKPRPKIYGLSPPRHSSTLPKKKREGIPENTVFQGFLRGQGWKGKDLKEKRKEEGKMAQNRCLVGFRETAGKGK